MAELVFVSPDTEGFGLDSIQYDVEASQFSVHLTIEDNDSSATIFLNTKTLEALLKQLTDAHLKVKRFRTLIEQGAKVS